jgi:hypothetical protein
MSRPIWSQLDHRQKLAAFCIDQDNFEQNGCPKAQSWEYFKESFTDEEEWKKTWSELNRRANTFDQTTEDWKACMNEYLKAGR